MKKIFALIFCSLLVVLAIAPSALSFSVGKQNNLIIASIGDSQTAERSSLGGAYMVQTYPYVAAQSRAVANVINAGISGNTTTQMNARFATDVLASGAGAMSEMGFVNDLTTNISGGTWVGGGISAATTKANIKAMATAAIAAKAHFTILSAVPVFQTVYLNNASAYLTAVSQICSEVGTANCTYVDVYSAFIAACPGAPPCSLLLDEQHPNAAGHAFIASLASAPAFKQYP